MDANRFDLLLRRFGDLSSRRSFLGALAALVAPAAADARSGRRGPRLEGPCGTGSRADNICTKDSQCCTGVCDRKLGQKNKDRKGRCRCVRKGKRCKADKNCCREMSCSRGICGGLPVPTGGACTARDTCASASASCTTYTLTTPAGTYCLLPVGIACSANDDCSSRLCEAGVCRPCSVAACLAPCDGARVCASGCAFTAVQPAIDAASPGDIIDIGTGVYTESLTIPISLTLRACPGEDVTLKNAAYGERTIAVSNSAHLTVLNITVDGDADRGNANYGGGISTDGSLTLAGKTIVRNGGAAQGGGAEVTGDNLVITVTDRVIMEANGVDSYGGALYVAGESDVLIAEDAIVRNNTADSYGGGLFVSEGANLTIRDRVLIDGNRGGGFAHRRGDSTRFYAVTITDDVVISGNIASTEKDGGGGIVKVGRADPYYPGTFTVSGRVRITGNTSDYDGGGLAIGKVPTTISGTVEISGNNANNSNNGEGGGIWIRGGSDVPWPAGVVGLTITDSVKISGNDAQWGAGIFLEGTTAAFSGSARVAGNTAAQEGGGVYLNFLDDQPGSLAITGNATVTSNSAVNSGGGGYSDDVANTLSAPAGAVSGNTPDQCAGAASGGALTC